MFLLCRSMFGYLHLWVKKLNLVQKAKYEDVADLIQKSSLPLVIQGEKYLAGGCTNFNKQSTCELALK